MATRCCLRLSGDWRSARRPWLLAASAVALAACLAPRAAEAACPLGQVTSGTVSLVPGDICPFGLQAGAGGVILAPGVSVPLVVVAAAPAAVTASDGGIISFSGTNSIINGSGVGVQVGAGSRVTLEGPTSVSSTGATGIAASGANALIDGSGLASVSTTGTGFNVRGVFALGGARITPLGGLAVATSGVAVDGVEAQGPGSFVDATHGSQITVNADTFASAVNMVDGGLVKLDASTRIVTNGASAFGLLIDGTDVPDGTIGPGLVLNMNGAGGFGLEAVVDDARFINPSPTRPRVSIDRLTITGPGVRFGVAADSGSTVTLSNSSVTASGASGAALVLQGGDFYTDGATINFVNSTARSAAGTLAGVRARTGTAAAANVLNISGGSLVAEGAPAILSQGAFLNANISNGAQVSGAGLVQAVAFPATSGLRVESAPGAVQPAIVNLSATTGAVLTGDALADAGSTLNISLAGGSTWTGAATNVTNVVVGEGGRWTMTGDSSVSNSLQNHSVVEFVPYVSGPFTPHTLTTRSYSAASVLGLNTFLEGDGSPSDRLVIDGGAASGVTSLRITNAGGAGAVTSAGILVIASANGGSIPAGAFALETEAAAGPYRYRLYRGAVDGSALNNWYLRSNLTCEGPNPPAPCPPDPTPDPGPGPGPDPDPPPLFPVSIPDYRVETSLYTALPALAQLYGRAAVDNLHDRVGEEEQLRGRTGDAPYANGAWARYLAWRGHRDGGRLGIYSDEGPGFDYDLDGLQLGFDAWRRETAEGVRDHVGAYGAYGQARADVEHFDRVSAGKAEIEAWSLGAYWTHFRPNGAYLDAVAQYTWYDAVARSPRLPALTGDARGWALSMEGGWPFAIARGGWVLEPQLQLTYQTFEGDPTSDVAARVDFQNTDSLIGRVGLRAAKTWSDASNPTGVRLTTGWLRVNYSQEFEDGPVTTFSSARGPVAFQADLGQGWIQTDAGLTKQITANAALLVVGGYQWTQGSDAHAWTGKFGMRFNW